MTMVFGFGRTLSIPECDLPFGDSVEGAEVEASVTIGDTEDSPVSIRFKMDELVEFVVEPGHTWVVPLRSIGPRSLEHYVADHAIPLALGAAGDIIIHGAGLCLNGVGVLLLGQSGAGKSTASAHLVRHGWQSLGDDGVRLEVDGDQVIMWPSYPGIRLHEDVLESGALSTLPVGGLVAEYHTKSRVRTDAIPYSADPVPLIAVVSLGDDGPAELEPLGPAAGCSALTQSLFVPPMPESEAVEQLFRLAPVAAAVLNYRLRYPRTAAGSAQLIQILTKLAVVE